MNAKSTVIAGLKAAGAMSAGNLLILGIMVALGYGAYPVDPEGGELSGLAFTIATVITGGVMPGLLGSFVWLRIHGRWPSNSQVLFVIFALTIATSMTLPVTNPNSPSGDAFILTTVLHYSTALLGSWLIPRFCKNEGID